MNRKYQRLFLIVIIICAIGTGFYISANNTIYVESNDNEQLDKSKYDKILPESIISTILSADSIRWVLIDAWVSNDSSSTIYGDTFGEILVSKYIVDSIANGSISELLISSDSFQDDGIVKESTFMPDFGVFFMNPTDTVVVSYSLYCDICRFQNKREALDLNGEIIRDKFIHNLKSVFPKDKFVRNISRRI